MDMDYNDQNNTNGYDSGWRQIDDSYPQTGYSEYSELTGGFESGNAVHTAMHQLKSLGHFLAVLYG